MNGNFSSVIIKSVAESLRSGEMGSVDAQKSAWPAVLRVHRRQNPWRDRLVDYVVQVDGATVGEVPMGESRDFGLSSGEHDIRLRMAGAVFDRPSKLFGSRTQRLLFEDGDLVDIICGPNGPSILAFLLFLIPHRYIKMENPRRFTIR